MRVFSYLLTFGSVLLVMGNLERIQRIIGRSAAAIAKEKQLQEKTEAKLKELGGH